MQIYVILTILCFLFAIQCLENDNDLLVTKNFISLTKSQISTWETLDYEDHPLKGWTISEFQDFLPKNLPSDFINLETDPNTAFSQKLPRKIDWKNNHCIFPIKQWGICGWTHSTVTMLSERCCLSGTDVGLLSQQEVISCDTKSHGCDGGWPAWILEYAHNNRGLVTEKCDPLFRIKLPCPTRCLNGDDWKKSHMCDCVGGYKKILKVDDMKNALLTGPIIGTMGVCRSFAIYRSGIYHCNCGGEYIGMLPVEIIGYGNEPECYFHGKGPWGNLWGDEGYFKIGCNECGIDGKYENGNVYCEKVMKHSADS